MTTLTFKDWFIAIGLMLMCVLVINVWAAVVRYPIGQPVPSQVYTEPFDPCDPAYKFFQTRYGDPNAPRLQAAPDDWVQQFGNNERTMLLHTISELRVVVAEQSRKILELEKKLSGLEQIDVSDAVLESDPNEGKE